MEPGGLSVVDESFVYDEMLTPLHLGRHIGG
jgi:hypothetical protein